MGLTVSQHIRQHALTAAGCWDAPRAPSLKVIRRINWYRRIFKYARNRMIMGYFRYGSFKDPGQPKYDRVGSALHRLKKYQRTGNLEFVVDAFNLLGIEFEKPNHPGAHFKSVDDGVHTPVLKRNTHKT